MGYRERFMFDDELIDLLHHELDWDCCGAAPACYDEICACYQLGRDGSAIDVFGSDIGGYGFYRDPQRRTFAKLAEAVRANQTALETSEILPTPPDDDIAPDLIENNVGMSQPDKSTDSKMQKAWVAGIKGMIEGGIGGLLIFGLLMHEPAAAVAKSCLEIGLLAGGGIFLVSYYLKDRRKR